MILIRTQIYALACAVLPIVTFQVPGLAILPRGIQHDHHLREATYLSVLAVYVLTTIFPSVMPVLHSLRITCRERGGLAGRLSDIYLQK